MDNTANLARVLALLTGKPGGDPPQGEEQPSIIDELSKRLGPKGSLPLSRPGVVPTPDWPEIF